MEIWENLIDLMLRALLVMIVVEQHPKKIENGLKRGEDTGRVEWNARGQSFCADAEA